MRWRRLWALPVQAARGAQSAYRLVVREKRNLPGLDALGGGIDKTVDMPELHRQSAGIGLGLGPVAWSVIDSLSPCSRP
jgi:hypothetical protein